MVDVGLVSQRMVCPQTRSLAAMKLQDQRGVMFTHLPFQGAQIILLKAGKGEEIPPDSPQKYLYNIAKYWSKLLLQLLWKIPIQSLII